MAKCTVKIYTKIIERIVEGTKEVNEYHLVLSEDEAMYLKAILAKVTGIPEGHDEIFDMYNALHKFEGLPWYEIPRTAKLF